MNLICNQTRSPHYKHTVARSAQHRLKTDKTEHFTTTLEAES